MTAARRRRACITRCVVVASALVLGACAKDLDLGVGADVQSAAITVSGAPGQQVIAADLTVEFYVGNNASGDRMFNPSRIDVMVGNDFAATLVPMRPAGFDGVLSPGQSEVVTYRAATEPGAGNAALLCPPTMPASLVVRFNDRTNDELGNTTASTTNITCQ